MVKWCDDDCDDGDGVGDNDDDEEKCEIGNIQNEQAEMKIYSSIDIMMMNSTK